MPINIKGPVKVTTLHDTKIPNRTFPHRGALGTILKVINRNGQIAHTNQAAILTKLGNNEYLGGYASAELPVRSCHGDENLHVTINAVQYNAVELKANPAFQNGNVEIVWWDYACNATTSHVANQATNIAAFVEFDLEDSTNIARYLNHLKNQMPWFNNLTPPPPVFRFNMGTPFSSIEPPDGPRVLYHIIGDFFVYSPDHYANGYVVVDDSNNLLQTRNFI